MFCLQIFNFLNCKQIPLHKLIQDKTSILKKIMVNRVAIDVMDIFPNKISEI